MFKHNWAWIKSATDKFSTVLTRNLRNPRDYAPLSNEDFSFQFNVFGGLQYVVRLWAETLKPGPAAIESVLVLTYSSTGIYKPCVS